MSSSKNLSQSESDWTLSLDLLIARAALDQSLRSELLLNPKKCCSANGVIIPDDIHLVFTNIDQELLIREIPTIPTITSDCVKTEWEPAHYNENVTEADIAAEQYEAAQVVTAAEVEAEAVAGTVAAAETATAAVSVIVLVAT